MPETSSAGLFYCFYFHNDTANDLLTEEHYYKEEQECIPVGCVPPMAVAVQGGGLPQCMLGYTPQVWAWRPPWPDPSTCPPQGVGQKTPWRPAARHAGIPPARHAGIPSPGDLLQGMLGYHPQETCCKACWDTTPPWTDRHM